VKISSSLNDLFCVSFERIEDLAVVFLAEKLAHEFLAEFSLATLKFFLWNYQNLLYPSGVFKARDALRLETLP
jgi:hypothetical protein